MGSACRKVATCAGQHKHGKECRHLCLQWDSNLWSQCSSGRRRFMSSSARPPWYRLLKFCSTQRISRRFECSPFGVKTRGLVYKHCSVQKWQRALRINPICYGNEGASLSVSDIDCHIVNTMLLGCFQRTYLASKYLYVGGKFRRACNVAYTRCGVLFRRVDDFNSVGTVFRNFVLNICS
jgi:hypothetical protein